MLSRARAASIAHALTGAVFTSMCAECNRRGAWVCAECRARVVPITRPGCSRCGVALQADCECAWLPEEIEQLRSVYPYAGWVRSSIHRFKYDGEFARAAMLALEFDRIRPLPGALDVIVPAPIHRHRLRERGFNQAGLIARHLAPMWGLSYADALERQGSAERQVGKTRDARWLNVSGVFTCTSPALISGQRVAVVDDVITTGATISECATALANAGAISVVGISLARG